MTDGGPRPTTGRTLPREGIRRPVGRAEAKAPAGAKLLVWLLVVAVLGHTAAIALWVGPDNPIRREVGASTLRSYAEPVFEQNWQIFAPTPRRVAVTFELRARVVDPDTGTLVTTEWVDAVAGEDALIRGNPAPPRMSLAARRTANRLNNAMREMNPEQREQIEAHYRTTPIEDLRPRLLRGEGDSPASTAWVDRYLEFDEVATEFATYYAAHLWQGEVQEIQYRTTNRRVPTYESRADRTIDDAEPVVYDYGWRTAADVDPRNVVLFGRYVDRAMGSS